MIFILFLFNSSKFNLFEIYIINYFVIFFESFIFIGFVFIGYGLNMYDNFFLKWGLFYGVCVYNVYVIILNLYFLINVKLIKLVIDL